MDGGLPCTVVRTVQASETTRKLYTSFPAGNGKQGPHDGWPTARAKGDPLSGKERLTTPLGARVLTAAVSYDSFCIMGYALTDRHRTTSGRTRSKSVTMPGGRFVYPHGWSEGGANDERGTATRDGTRRGVHLSQVRREDSTSPRRSMRGGAVSEVRRQDVAGGIGSSPAAAREAGEARRGLVRGGRLPANGVTPSTPIVTTQQGEES